MSLSVPQMLLSNKRVYWEHPYQAINLDKSLQQLQHQTFRVQTIAPFAYF
jgi:hypothetical protein